MSVFCLTFGVFPFIGRAHRTSQVFPTQLLICRGIGFFLKSAFATNAHVETISRFLIGVNTKIVFGNICPVFVENNVVLVFRISIEYQQFCYFLYAVIFYDIAIGSCIDQPREFEFKFAEIFYVHVLLILTTPATTYSPDFPLVGSVPASVL
jgi:hypothetical protein